MMEVFFVSLHLSTPEHRFLSSVSKLLYLVPFGTIYFPISSSHLFKGLPTLRFVCHDSIWQHAQLTAICSTRFIHHNIIMMEVQEMKIVRRITEKSLRNMLRSEALRRKYQIDKINDLVFGEKFSGMII